MYYSKEKRDEIVLRRLSRIEHLVDRIYRGQYKYFTVNHVPDEGVQESPTQDASEAAQGGSSDDESRETDTQEQLLPSSDGGNSDTKEDSEREDGHSSGDEKKRKNSKDKKEKKKKVKKCLCCDGEGCRVLHRSPWCCYIPQKISIPRDNY